MNIRVNQICWAARFLPLFRRGLFTEPRLTMPQVILCTFSATCVRIAQAYFSGGQLVISLTDWSNMEEENHHKAKLVLGWMMSLTGGKTLFHDIAHTAQREI